ncbi:MAG: isoaspartyl peptidase/L-asparaginase [Balneolaceae bacterium]|nr:isoaspartyl peptidase/L-asparaginase [Balneolaceae bacterium]
MNRFKNLSLFLLAALVATACMQNGSDASYDELTGDATPKEWAIVLHGGAGTIPQDLPDSVVQGYRASLDSALTIGEEILAGGGTSQDAVERVINYLEDNPRFNAGKGAVFTHEGAHELDAAFMVGNTREAGTITGVRTVKNPISLARMVMENSRHVMFAGDGAEDYADEMGVERVNQDYFFTERRHQAWKEAISEDDQSALPGSLPEGASAEAYEDYLWEEYKFGTVGCVALDRNGTLVAGTSTGGMTNKMYGRVGDVPIVGSGTYASDVVAVSMTGWGEKIMRAVSGHTVSSYMKYKPATLDSAASHLLRDVLDPGDAGMIAVDRYGNMVMDMNTTGMYRGMSDSEGNREVAIWN